MKTNRPKRLTFASVNKALVAKYGIADLRLAQASGYLYFWGGDCHMWHSSAILMPCLNRMTLEQIFQEYDRLKADYEETK
jgi:hypothetical protein